MTDLEIESQEIASDKLCDEKKPCQSGAWQVPNVQGEQDSPRNPKQLREDQFGPHGSAWWVDTDRTVVTTATQIAFIYTYMSVIVNYHKMENQVTLPSKRLEEVLVSEFECQPAIKRWQVQPLPLIHRFKFLEMDQSTKIPDNYQQQQIVVRTGHQAQLDLN